MKIKTSELTGAALDWAVAMCEEGEAIAIEWHPHKAPLSGVLVRVADPYCPSTNWKQGGPIIEREGIVPTPAASKSGDMPWLLDCWQARTFQDHLNDVEDDAVWFDGPTILIAAMRCYVASKLGDEVEVPDVLMMEV